MFKRPAFLQSRRNEKREGDWSAFPIRQLFVLGEYIDIAPHHNLDLRSAFSFLCLFFFFFAPNPDRILHLAGFYWQ